MAQFIVRRGEEPADEITVDLLADADTATWEERRFRFSERSLFAIHVAPDQD